jgi:hypothetical protein
MSTKAELKAPMSVELINAYEKLMKSASKVPESDFFATKFTGIDGDASLANIISYQIGWGKPMYRMVQKRA